MKLLHSDGSIAVVVKDPGTDSEKLSSADLFGPDGKGGLFCVHRLDRDTGGVMVYARTKETSAALSAAFAAGDPVKYYIAAVQGTPDPSGEMNDLLFHHRATNKTYVVGDRRKGVKEASLSYRTLPGSASGLTPVLVRLHTGRTHQIRVQFASRGMPLAGDGRYGSSVKAPHMALWSCGLGFTHPASGKKMFFTSMPPAGEEPWSMLGDTDTMTKTASELMEETQ